MVDMPYINIFRVMYAIFLSNLFNVVHLPCGRGSVWLELSHGPCNVVVWFHFKLKRGHELLEFIESCKFSFSSDL